MIVKEKDMLVGYTRSFRKGISFWVDVKEERHKIKFGQIEEEKVLIQIFSEVKEKWIGVGEEWYVELNNDSFYDLYVKVNSFSGNYINFTIKEIEIVEEKIVEEKIVEEGGDNKIDGETNETREIEKEGLSDKNKSFVVLGIVIIGILIFIISLKVKKRRNNKKQIKKIKIKRESSKNNRKKVLKRLNKIYKKNSG